MKTLGQIIFQSIKSTSTKPRWWIFALLQLVAFVTISSLARPKFIFSPNVFWLLLALAALQPVSIYLWFEIEANYNFNIKNVPIKNFFSVCLSCFSLTFFSVCLLIFAKFIYFNWIFIVLLSSLVASTTALCALYMALLEVSVFKAFVLTIDTWHKKISLPLATAFVLVIAQGAGFVFAHEFFRGFLKKGEFSALQSSATIWLLLVFCTFFLSFLVAFLNTFVVTLFLEIVKRNKDKQYNNKVLENFAPYKA